MKYKFIVISLPTSTDRRQNITDIFIKLNIQNYQFFDACNGKEIKQDTNCYVHTWDNKKIRPIVYNNKIRYYDERRRLNTKIMSPGELGCAWSHIDIYERLVSDDEYDAYFILEDDTSLDVNKQLFDEYMGELPDKNEFDLCHFSTSQCYPFKFAKKVNDKYSHIEKIFFNRTDAYFITRNGAIKLLQSTCPFISLPSDDLISETNMFDSSFRVIVPHRNLFTQGTFPSLISS